MLRMLLIYFVISCPQVFAKKITIITDQPGAVMAKKVKKLIFRTKPFNYIEDLRIQIVRIPLNSISCKSWSFKPTKKELREMKRYLESKGRRLPKKCERKFRRGFTVERAIVCNKKAVKRILRKHKSDYGMFIKDSEKYGGSAGEFANLTTSVPLGTALHELMHLFGFADEYAYGICEAPFFCNEPSVNVTFIDGLDYYESDLEAKSIHQNDIPWIDQIPLDTPIIGKGYQLGTPRKFKDSGLFRGQTCIRAKPFIPTWKPARAVTVMERSRSHRIPQSYYPVIFAALDSESTVTFEKTELQHDWLIKLKTSLHLFNYH